MKQPSTMPFRSMSCPNKFLQIFLAAMVLAVVLIFTATTVSAAVFPGSDGIPVKPYNQATFENWLIATGLPIYSHFHAYKASFEIWRDYSLLVYGGPSKVPGNQYSSSYRQYANLGFSYDEIKVTNSLFPDNAPGGVTQTTPWQWNERDQGQSGRISWNRLSASQKNLIKNSVLTYRNNSYGNMTFSQLNLNEYNTLVLAPPSWYMGFALYTTHYLPGTTQIRYATFNGAGSGSVAVASSININNSPAADGRYVIGSQSDYIDISYSVNGLITAFNGLATASDIQFCGAGNAQGWVNGQGTGPWTQTNSFRVSRADLAAGEERSYLLTGQAWVVSRMGDIQLSQVEKTIVVRAERQAPLFEVKAEIQGGVKYFSGQTNSQGQFMPMNTHRFLGLERMKLLLDFTAPPQSIQYTFGGQTFSIPCASGVLHYETSFIIPNLPSTLSWSGGRLQPSMSLSIQATDRTSPTQIATAVISDIELTGNIYNIAYAQLRKD